MVVFVVMVAIVAMVVLGGVVLMMALMLLRMRVVMVAVMHMYTLLLHPYRNSHSRSYCPHLTSNPRECHQSHNVHNSL